MGFFFLPSSLATHLARSLAVMRSAITSGPGLASHQLCTHLGLVGDLEPWVRVPALTPSCLQALSWGSLPGPGPAPPLPPCCRALFFQDSHKLLFCCKIASNSAQRELGSEASWDSSPASSLHSCRLQLPVRPPGAVSVPLPPRSRCWWKGRHLPAEHGRLQLLPLADGIRHPGVLGERETPGHAAPVGTGGALAHPPCPEPAHGWAKGFAGSKGQAFPAASSKPGVSPPAPMLVGSDFRPVRPRNAIYSLHLLRSSGVEWA